MTDRRFELIRTAAGFDLGRVTAAPPQPGPGEVLVRVHAASLNRRDLMIRALRYPASGDRFVPLCDAAGEIEAVGPGVTGLAVGDRVCSTFFQDWPDGPPTLPRLMSALGAGGRGVLADRIVLNQSGIAPMPDGWSYAEAACLPCAAVTAWSGLRAAGGIRAGDWVLVIGTGGVGLFALQMALAMGAKVIVLSGSPAKLARTQSMGATVGIDTTATPDWSGPVRAATGGHGVDRVIELGGQGTLGRSLASAAIGGHIALIGGLDGFGGTIDGGALAISMLSVGAVGVGTHADHLAMSDFLAGHAVRPVIDSVTGADDAEAAYARAGAGAFGKVVLDLADRS